MTLGVLRTDFGFFVDLFAPRDLQWLWDLFTSQSGISQATASVAGELQPHCLIHHGSNSPFDRTLFAGSMLGRGRGDQNLVQLRVLSRALGQMGEAGAQSSRGVEGNVEETPAQPEGQGRLPMGRILGLGSGG